MSASQTASTPLLDARDLAVTLSDTANLQNVSLTLKRGDVLGLLGLNGAGKSTTLKLLCGALAPDAGSVVISGFRMDEDPLLARQHLGYLADQPPLYPDMRVTAYLILCARLRRIPRSQASTRAEAVIEQCELTGVRNKRIATLSKGFRQRVGLAQALVHEPDVVLLDEPSNGLDPQQMQGMRDLITTLGQDRAIVFSTHLLGEARAVCNRIAVMHQGRLIADQASDADDNDLETLFTQLVTEHAPASEPAQP